MPDPSVTTAYTDLGEMETCVLQIKAKQAAYDAQNEEIAQLKAEIEILQTNHPAATVPTKIDVVVKETPSATKPGTSTGSSNSSQKTIGIINVNSH